MTSLAYSTVFSRSKRWGELPFFLLSVDPLLSPSLRPGLSLSVKSLPPLPGPSNLPLGLLDGDPPHAPPGHGVQVGIDVPLHGHAADAQVVGAWYVKPGGHGMHTEAPAVETVPHGHATQLAAPESGRRRLGERGKAAQPYETHNRTTGNCNRRRETKIGRTVDWREESWPARLAVLGGGAAGRVGVLVAESPR